MRIKSFLKSIKDKNTSLFTYFVLCAVRILMVFLPQIGYIHPDEFFQTVEVVSGNNLLIFIRFKNIFTISMYST